MDVRSLRDSLAAAARYAPPETARDCVCESSAVAPSGTSDSAVQAEARYNPLARRAVGAACAGPADSSSEEEDEPREDRSVRSRVARLCTLYVDARSRSAQAAALRAYYSRRRYALQARTQCAPSLSCVV